MPVMETTIENTIRNYLRAKATVEAATEEMKSLEETIKQEMVRTGTDKIKVDNKIVSIVSAERRSFDASALRNLVSAATFNKVTEPSVKTSLFDSAVKLGVIAKDIEEQVVNRTPYSQLRIK